MKFILASDQSQVIEIQGQLEKLKPYERLKHCAARFSVFFLLAVGSVFIPVFHIVCRIDGTRNSKNTGGTSSSRARTRPCSQSPRGDAVDLAVLAEGLSSEEEDFKGRTNSTRL